ncbi:MAG TPA: hypothetical protein DCG69_05005 [Bacteroidales bacterium]|nr:hypothetical protein [Bacteroidales bacterium]
MFKNLHFVLSPLIPLASKFIKFLFRLWIFGFSKYVGISEKHSENSAFELFFSFSLFYHKKF